MSKSRQNSNTPNRLSVADRTELLTKTGTREGEVILQRDIGLLYAWTDTQGTDNGGTILNVGTGSWLAQYSGAVNVKWFNNQTSAANFCEANSIGLEVDSDTTFNIPTDYTTLQAALESVRVSSDSSNIILNIESLHVLTQSVYLTGGDYSKITIKSVDATVKMSPSITMLASFGYFVFADCLAPIIEFTLDIELAGGVGSIAGMYYVNSRGRVQPSAGAINAGYRGLYVVGSHVRAQGSVWTGALDSGVRCSNNAVANLRDADVSNSATGVSVGGASLVGVTSLVATNCTLQGVYVQNGYCAGSGVDVSDAGSYGLNIYQGHFTGNSLVADRAGINGILCVGGGRVISTSSGAPTPYSILNSVGSAIVAKEGSIISIQSVVATGAGAYGVKAETLSVIDCSNGDLSGATTSCIHASGGASVQAKLATLSGSDKGIIADEGGIVYAISADISNSTTYSIDAQDGARVIARNSNCNTVGNRHIFALDSEVDISSATLLASAGTYSVYIDGSKLIAKNVTSTRTGSTGLQCISSEAIIIGSNFTSDGTTITTSDIRAINGSTIRASGSTGGVNQAVNTLFANGIIFK